MARVKRHQRNLEKKAQRLARQLRNHQTDIHHQPPRSNGYNKQTGFVLVKRIIDHRAYHQLFKNAGSYEECCAILLKDWWTKGE